MREKTRSIKHSPHEHEDLSSDPQHSRKKPDFSECTRKVGTDKFTVQVV